MRKCLSPARLLCLDRRSLLRNPLAAVRPPFRAWTTQWIRQFSVGVKPPIVDRRVLQDQTRLKFKRCPVPRSQEKDLEAWLSLLDHYLPPSLRRSSEDTPADSVHDPPSELTRESFVQTLDLVNLLFYARASVKLDILAHLGFRLNNWPAVYVLLNRLLDAADALNDVSLPLQCGIIDGWASNSNVSLDQLTDQCLSSSPQFSGQSSKIALIPGLTTLDAFTERPFAQDHIKSLMAEVWQSLGSIVLEAADVPTNESKLAMSYVYRILARLHHSGVVSERVYRYVSPDSYQATFRPPGMHLLSTHIMDVLSDSAWLAHQAEVAAKAAAAGEDSPFLPVQMGIKELGHEIWLEFILWCCVEHGHIKEGVWLIDQVRARTGDLAWKFQSWKPLLQDLKSLRKIKIDREVVSWHRPELFDSAPRQRKRNEPPSPFHGLGKRTLSVEVATALLDNIPNLVYLGLGFRGVHADALLRHVNSLRFSIGPVTSDDKFLPTIKATNWFTVRVIESGGLNPEADPQTFEDFLRVTPCVVPPWSTDMCSVDEDSLGQLRPSQLYDDTSALAGLMEYNLRFYSARRICGDALNMFAMLQAVVDTSKMQRIDEFFSSRMEFPSASLPSSTQLGSLPSLKPFQSSIPQISNVTLAQLLDLVTASRAFAFGEWLLFSDDIDGPALPPSAYGDQALAPSILRFAAATKNNDLCESVVRSLAQPVSSNTLRALLNFRIATQQWDLIVPMLEYLRDYRSKSWGHSNLAALAGEIIRLDHTLQQQESSDLSSMSAAPSITKQNLSQAKDILTRTLRGEFNELPHRRAQTQTRIRIRTRTQSNPNNFQNRSLYAFHRLLLSIPTSTSPTLHEITTTTAPLLPYKPPTPSTALPYLPSTSFDLILSAIVDTQGSAAGKRLWDRWCLDTKSPASLRMQEGGIPRFHLGHERNPLKGDPHFDAAYFREVQRKATIPNLGTVRIIAQRAVKEYEEACEADARAAEVVSSSSSASPSSASGTETETETDKDNDKLSSPASGSASASASAEKILVFCKRQFEMFGLRRREINRELGGFVYRRQREYEKEKRRRNKLRPGEGEQRATSTSTSTSTAPLAASSGVSS